VRIAYGVNGYGRGHAMRVAAVLPRLTEHHQVRVFAGADAYDALAPQYEVIRIPSLRYHYRQPGKLSWLRTLHHNVPMALDLLWGGGGVDMVCDSLREFGAELIISDSEAYTLRAGGRLGIPRISFDNFGQLAYCRLRARRRDRLKLKLNAWGYVLLLGHAERVLLASFFNAPAKGPHVHFVGPVIRREVMEHEPTCGEYLLTYISKEAEYTPRVEQALLEAGCPVRLYGTSRRGLYGRIEYKPLANLSFIEDLAGCRAVFGTTGNQLLSEVIHFRKPMLCMPIDCMEQRINADELKRLGVAEVVSPKHVTGRVIRAFWAREAGLAANYSGCTANGCSEAVELIERFARELGNGSALKTVAAEGEPRRGDQESVSASSARALSKGILRSTHP